MITHYSTVTRTYTRQRSQRQYPTRLAADAAAEKRIKDPKVKAVWIFDSEGTEVFHQNKGT